MKPTKKRQFYKLYSDFINPALTPSDILILIIINYLAGIKGHCSASNEYLLRKLNGVASNSTLKRSIKKLKNLGIISVSSIKISYEGKMVTRRKIYCNDLIESNQIQNDTSIIQIEQ